MADKDFDPGSALGNEIKELSRRELCELASRLCSVIKAQAGPEQYRGGIYPENISTDKDGNVAVGSTKDGDWCENELEFLAPEIFWKGEKSAAADVYSVGMLLYYAASGGKLPFAEAGDAREAIKKRMNGAEIEPPQAAGARLGEIISRSTAFSPAKRFQSVDELKAMLDSCVKNLYLSGAPSAETIFHKNDDDLSPMERLMINIIEKSDGEGDMPACPPEPEKSPETENRPPEPETEAQEVKPAEPETEAQEKKPAEAEPAAEETELQEKKSEEEKPQKAEAKPENAAEPEKAAVPEYAGDEKSAGQETDVRVYVPDTSKKNQKKKKTANPNVPTLREEKNPELAPVQPQRREVKPAVQYGKTMERERNISKAMNRRRLPIVIVAIFCALLIVIAIIVNAIIKDKEAHDPENMVQFAPTVEATPVPTPTPAATEAPEDDPALMPYIPVEHRYEIFVEDVSWTEARDRCREKGGYLAVVSDADEFEQIVEMAEERGVNKVWLGCHRIDGQLVWENTDPVNFYQWAQGEPSEYDWNDDVPEDYLMLWNHNGWYYNDSRNDPVADYPEMYSGQLAYVCEFDGE